MMGKAEKKVSPKTLRNIHKISGFLFFILLFVISYFCIKYWIQVGDQVSVRAVFHGVLAFGLIIIFLLKVTIVKFYKQFLRFAPVLGMLVFCFAFVVFCTSAGFYFLRTLCASPVSAEDIPPVSSEIVGRAEIGGSFFNTNCLSCHYADTEDKKIGPGLKDLFKKEKLPYSGRPTNVENIKQQLTRPALVMPSFAKLTGQEMADLFAYLQTL
jgi:mono/diheme cytochrome c family protein